MKYCFNYSRRAETMSLLDEINIVIKDEEMNAMYKLPQVVSILEKNCVFHENGKMIAKLNNRYYEVKK